jgi:endoglucanase
MTRLETLKQLSEAVAVSGDEAELRKLIRERVKEHLTDLKTDVVGNLSGIKKGTGETPLRVLLAAPMDERGFMITEVGDDGLISIEDIGKHDVRTLATQRVLVGKDKQPGVMLWTPIHRSNAMALQHVDNISIDVGADGKGGVKAKPGDRVGFLGTFREISDTVVRGKAFESRAACAALLEIIEGEPFPFDLHVAFTAQSHGYTRGAALLASRLQPHLALTLTGIHANEVPGAPDEPAYTARVKLGKGAVLRLSEPGYAASRELTRHIREVAAAHNIPLQVHAQSHDKSETLGYGTSYAGTHAATLAVPIRYLETPNSLLNLNDLDALINLTRSALQTLSPAVLGDFQT